MKNIVWNKNTLFGSVVPSRRHIELGYCESSDFGIIELMHIEESEKQLIVSFKDGNKNCEFVEFDGHAYKKMHEVPRISRADSDSLIKMQGRFTLKMAIALALKIRQSMETCFSHPGQVTLLLIGKTLYQKSGSVDKLVVNTCGNLVFSHWLSVDIEMNNPNKQAYPLNKTSFEAVVKESRDRFNENKPKPGQTKGDCHVSFSYPKAVKWGVPYQV